MVRGLKLSMMTLAWTAILASCAADQALVGRPLAAPPEAEPVVVEEEFAIDLPVIETLVVPDAEVVPADSAAATWLVATAERSSGISVDQDSLDCATAGIVQVLGEDRSLQLADSDLTDEEIPLIGELLGICTADADGGGRLYAEAAGLALSEPTLDCLDAAFTDPLVAKAATTAALWAVESDVAALPADVDQVAVDAVVSCLNDDELARLLG